MAVLASHRVKMCGPEMLSNRSLPPPAYFYKTELVNLSRCLLLAAIPFEVYANEN